MGSARVAGTRLQGNAIHSLGVVLIVTLVDVGGRSSLVGGQPGGAAEGVVGAAADLVEVGILGDLGDGDLHDAEGAALGLESSLGSNGSFGGDGSSGGNGAGGKKAEEVEECGGLHVVGFVLDL